MQTIWDMIRRAMYICIFIVPIPFGAYTIHNGSSAVVALFSYCILSIAMPFFYFRSKKSGVGPEKKRIYPFLYILGWFILQGTTYMGFTQFDFSFLWQLPSIGRDISFIIIMYTQVLLAIGIGYILSRCVPEKR